MEKKILRVKSLTYKQLKSIGGTMLIHVDFGVEIMVLKIAQYN